MKNLRKTRSFWTLNIWTTFFCWPIDGTVTSMASPCSADDVNPVLRSGPGTLQKMGGSGYLKKNPSKNFFWKIQWPKYIMRGMMKDTTGRLGTLRYFNRPWGLKPASSTKDLRNFFRLLQFYSLKRPWFLSDPSCSIFLACILWRTMASETTQLSPAGLVLSHMAGQSTISHDFPKPPRFWR